jgi:hypothetical protein
MSSFIHARLRAFFAPLSAKIAISHHSGSRRVVEMRISLAAAIVALWAAPLYAQTSGPSGIQGVESDDFSPLMKINGIVEKENPFGGIARTWKLRSFVSRFDGATKHQLYVSANYFVSGGRRNHFDEASDSTATPLKVVSIANDFEGGCSRKMFSFGCNYAEDIGIEITTEALRAHAATGYPIKISGKSGESFIVVVSSNQIAAQLDAMEKCVEYVHAHGGGAASQHGPQLISHSQLGFKASEITNEIAAKTGLHRGPGIVVFEVTPGSLAERSGLKVHDRIMAVAGCGSSIDSKTEMQKCVAQKKAYIGMVVDRSGSLTTVGMKLYTDGR